MMTKTRITAVLLVLAAGCAAYVAISIWRHGFSARENPSRVEAFLARHARRIATPAGAKGLKNPYQGTPESLAEAREHFVEHCATCHGLDGRGDTPIGRNLYPKAPNMTDAETQRLTDGELFYIISNGVRFTGMPAWGSEDSPQSIWELVAFIRRLPQLTPEELRLMQEQASGSKTEAEGAGHKPHTHAPGAHHHQH
jgi:mono/diheme cytochrome c family protein